MLKKIYSFYRDGFRSMTVGRTLWLIIGIKLFIMFGILRIFVFKYEHQGMNQEERAIKVRGVLTDRVVEIDDFESEN